jgi:hypothetical protein
MQLQPLRARGKPENQFGTPPQLTRARFGGRLEQRSDRFHGQVQRLGGINPFRVADGTICQANDLVGAKTIRRSRKRTW